MKGQKKKKKKCARLKKKKTKNNQYIFCFSIHMTTKIESPNIGPYLIGLVVMLGGVVLPLVVMISKVKENILK